jgi:hypothetical protein
MSTIIDVIGDPMIDIWLYPNNSRHTTPGGAFNVYENIKALISNHSEFIILHSTFPRPYKENLDYAHWMKYPAKLYRMKLNSEEIETIEDAIAWEKHCRFIRPLLLPFQLAEKRILVIADYNKGFVENNLIKLGDFHYDYIIIDSRYGLMDFARARRMCKTLIRRWSVGDSTTTYDWDITINTDGPNPTSLQNVKVPWTSYCPFFSEKPICTVGAGDTFTAAVASYLAIKNEPIDIAERILYWDHLLDWANQCCQDVIMQPRTAITKIRL